MNPLAPKIQVARLLQNQTDVLLLPFIRGEGRDEGLLVDVRVNGRGRLLASEGRSFPPGSAGFPFGRPASELESSLLMSSELWDQQTFTDRLREIGTRQYHHKHPFHVAMNEGRL